MKEVEVNGTGLPKHLFLLKADFSGSVTPYLFCCRQLACDYFLGFFLFLFPSVTAGQGRDLHENAVKFIMSL